MLVPAFKDIDDVLRKEAGCTTELDYTGQTSWLLFLRYLEPAFRSQTEKHELLHLYAAKIKIKIKNMGNAGEYYTARACAARC